MSESTINTTTAQCLNMLELTFIVVVVVLVVVVMFFYTFVKEEIFHAFVIASSAQK